MGLASRPFGTTKSSGQAPLGTTKSRGWRLQKDPSENTVSIITDVSKYVKNFATQTLVRIIENVSVEAEAPEARRGTRDNAKRVVVNNLVHDPAH